MLKIINKKIFNFYFVLSLLVITSAFFPVKTFAASLSLLPSPSTVSVGNIVSVKVYVNTESKYINNADATIQFPTDIVDVLSVTKNSSIFTLWVEEPNFSNSNGTITFNGGLPNPGYNGGSGYIATITFKAKKQGTASIIFTDGAVRANDGLGTDILSSKNGGIIQITAPVVTPVVNPKEVKTPDKKPTGKDVIVPFIPTVRFEGIQGIIKLSDEKNISNTDYFTIQLDEEINIKVKKEQLVNYEFNIPILNEGSHSATIVSFDKTGKYTENILAFISPAISVPVLELSSKEITVGGSVNVLGKTDYPNKQVNVILEQDGKEVKRYIQTTGIDGTFTVTTDKMNDLGIVSIFAETLLSDTVKSGPSEKIYLKVNETQAVKVTLAIVYPLMYLIVILAILLILLFLLYVGWHKFFGLKKKIEKETKQTVVDIHKAMSLLKDELTDQFNALEKVKTDRNLNEKEEQIYNEIKKNINGVDNFIEKKLKKLI